MPKFNIVKVKVEPLGFEFPDIFIKGIPNLVAPVPLFSDSTMALMRICYNSDKEFNKTYSDFYLLFISLVELYEIEHFTNSQNEYAIQLVNEISTKAEHLYHLLNS
jgi:hypothetical protein